MALLGTPNQNQTEKPVRVVGYKVDYKVDYKEFYVATDRFDLTNLGVFVPDFDSQLYDTIDTDFLLMFFLAIYGKEQVGNESAKYLRHRAMGTTGSSRKDFNLQ